MADTSNTSKLDVSEQLRQQFLQEINEASELLLFALSQGKNIDDDVISSIKKAENLLLKDDVPSQEERSEFEQNYRDLVHSMRPVTFTSYKNTSDKYGRKILLLSRKPISEGKIWSRKLWLITICFAVITFLGDYLQTMVNHPFFSVNYETGESVLGLRLITWQVLAGGLKAIVPFTYGGLGSCAYLLRECHKTVYKRTFDKNRVPEYYNRILLGVISGGAIMLFIAPEEQTTLKISAAALAFLTGYNTEFLFTTIERVANALFPKGTNAEGKTESQTSISASLSLEKLLARYDTASDEEKKILNDLIKKIKERI